MYTQACMHIHKHTHAHTHARTHARMTVTACEHKELNKCLVSKQHLYYYPSILNNHTFFVTQDKQGAMQIFVILFEHAARAYYDSLVHS